jgi:hypothetical protein
MGMVPTQVSLLLGALAAAWAARHRTGCGAHPWEADVLRKVVLMHLSGCGCISWYTAHHICWSLNVVLSVLRRYCTSMH